MSDTEVVPITGSSVNTAHYPRWLVFCHNDNVTTMDFVVFVLRGIFCLEKERAVKVMLEVHEKGVALVGSYAKEQAEFRIEQAHALARGHKFPLTLSMERE